MDDTVKTAFVFPGQGSQYVGMGKDLVQHVAAAAEVFERANAILGFDLRRICFEGPLEELKQTWITQPAIFVHSAAVLAVISTRPDMAAGHSLGEYTALYCAGALEFEEALKLVKRRGELMYEAGKRNPGTMAAIIGMPQEAVEEICRDASRAGLVQAANFNSPGQVVISGSVEGVHRAMEIARERGARLVKELVVSGAFHSPLMSYAVEHFSEELEQADVREAEIPVYSNVTAAPVRSAGEIRRLLLDQLTRPVLWEKSIRAMAADGAGRVVEIGPGKVLQGLTVRIDRAIEVSGLDTYESIRAFLNN
ncbi:MAG: ACP S-malonyltransferase [Chlorobi bacterium]|nr:ACP S-malonyltransferase [Chlorobiota bacterium]